MRLLVVLLLSSIFSELGEWEIVSRTGPAPRYINQLVTTDEGVLLFGGKHSESDGFNDLWLWNGENWKLLGAGAAKRWDHSYVYMAGARQLFLFGGRSFDADQNRIDLNDNWIFSNGEWRKLDIASPDPRSSFAMAYDEYRRKTVLFGGRNRDQVFGDTWLFDGEKWEKSVIPSPPARYGHTLVYDSKSKEAYLFGGFDGKNLLNDFWRFDGTRWIKIDSETVPSPRMAHAMQFDDAGNAILFGGWDGSAASGEFWTWNGERWSLLTLEKLPQARLSFAIGYDIKNEAFVLFGGSSGFGEGFFPETWVYKN